MLENWLYVYVYVYVFVVCVCGMCMCMCICMFCAHTHTHTHIYIYNVYVFVFCVMWYMLYVMRMCYVLYVLCDICYVLCDIARTVYTCMHKKVICACTLDQSAFLSGQNICTHAKLQVPSSLEDESSIPSALRCPQMRVGLSGIRQGNYIYMCMHTLCIHAR
jgi:hypothetical protein